MTPLDFDLDLDEVTLEEPPDGGEEEEEDGGYYPMLATPFETMS